LFAHYDILIPLTDFFALQWPQRGVAPSSLVACWTYARYQVVQVRFSPLIDAFTLIGRRYSRIPELSFFPNVRPKLRGHGTRSLAPLEFKSCPPPPRLDVSLVRTENAAPSIFRTPPTPGVEIASFLGSANRVVCHNS